MRYRYKILLTVFLMFLPAGLHADFTRNEAQKLLDGYIRAVQRGNDREIRAFWSTHFACEDFFSDVPICLDESAPWSEYISLLRKNVAHYRVKTVSGEKDCFVVHSELYLGSDEAKLGRDMPFYVQLKVLKGEM